MIYLSYDVNKQFVLFLTINKSIVCHYVCTISLRFRFRHFCQIQIWTPLMDTSNLIITGIQPGNAGKSSQSVIVFILVFNAGYRRFICYQCPNLNMREISESETNIRIWDKYLNLNLTLSGSMSLLGSIWVFSALCFVLSFVIIFCPSVFLSFSPLRDPVNDLVLCLLIKVRLEYNTSVLLRTCVFVSLTVWSYWARIIYR